MSAGNIIDFRLQVLRGMAALYAAHPRPLDLGPVDLATGKIDTDDDGIISTLSGTILWLHRNGLIMGKLQESGPFAVIMQSQLSPRAYAVLSSVDSNVGGALGQAIVDAVSAGDERESSVLADRLNDRLFPS